MSGSTFKYLVLLGLWMLVLPIQAADSKEKAKQKKEALKQLPLFQGIQLGAELGQPLSGLFSDSYGYSFQADVNLKNTWFPKIEFGFSHLDKTTTSGLQVLSSGTYWKLGANKAIVSLGDHAENMAYAGGALGISSFRYTLDSLQWRSNYWGSPQVQTFSDANCLVGWLEVTVGVRVQIKGPISMGWSGQYKSWLFSTGNSYGQPAWVPGYGSFVKPNVSLLFHLYYKLPF